MISLLLWPVWYIISFLHPFLLTVLFSPLLGIKTILNHLNSCHTLNIWQQQLNFSELQWTSMKITDAAMQHLCKCQWSPKAQYYLRSLPLAAPVQLSVTIWGPTLHMITDLGSTGANDSDPLMIMTNITIDLWRWQPSWSCQLSR